MTISCIRAYGAADAPEDLRGRARAIAPRRVLRLLDESSLPVVVAVAELKAAGWPSGWDEERIGLITVSAIEPAVGELPPDSDDPAYLREVFALVQSRKPTQWLSQMANNAACQAAITARILGPSIHFVGTGETCRIALSEAAGWLESGLADAVLAVAFDQAGDDEHAAGRVSAAGVAITRAGGTQAFACETAELTAAATGSTAVTAMSSLVAAIREAQGRRGGRDG